MIEKNRWAEIQTIVDQVFDHPTEGRMSFLKELCEGDSKTFREIEALLRAEEQSPDFLEEAAIDVASALTLNTAKESTPDFTGLTIGPYRLLKEIGRGGMGVVYHAQRHQGAFDQQAAIKLLRLDKNKTFREARFHREQQLLASLNHPNIAQLYDGGFTESGQPYIVMELVEGLPINQYCDSHTLNLDERLNLLLQVAEALKYAHQHLIVHRDIKPGNILVTPKGQVKLLDFGIAKLLEDESTLSAKLGDNESTNHDFSDLTHTGEQLLTPGFAAPEQIKNQNITVATDIYQLGLILYELLCGQYAYQDKADNFYSLAKLICESSPTAPSAVINQAVTISTANDDTLEVKSDLADTHSPDSTEKVSQARRLRPAQLHKLLKGDLDAIALKALRNEPDKRYLSMQEFVFDIEAYLNSHPVLARKQNVSYQTQKFIRRHLWQCCAAVSITALLITYAITVTVQSEKIKTALEQSRIESEKAQQVSNFLIQTFKASDPFKVGAEKISARQLLDEGQEKIANELHSAPAVRGHMLKVLGEINYSLGASNNSVELLEQSLEVNSLLFPETSPEIADNLLQLSKAYNAENQFDKVYQALDRAEAVYGTLKQNAADQHLPQKLEISNIRGHALYKQGQLEQAKNEWQSVLANSISETDDVQRELAKSLNNLSALQHREGKLDEAKTNMLAAIKINEGLLGSDHPILGLNLKNLAVKLSDWEYLDEANTYFRRAINIQISALGDEHPHVLNTLMNYAVLLQKTGEVIQSEQILLNVLKLQEQAHGSNSNEVAATLFRLGNVYQDLKKYSESESVYQRMLDIYQKNQSSSSIVGRALSQKAELHHHKGEFHIAKSMFENALKKLPPKGMRRSISELAYAKVLIDLAQYSDAATLSQKVLDYRQAKLPSTHNLIHEARIVKGVSLMYLGEKEEAQRLLVNAYKNLKVRRREGDAYTLLAQAALMKIFNVEDIESLNKSLSSI